MSILVVDIGSSSVRAMLFDMRARPIPGAQSSATYQIATEPPGTAILEMTQLQQDVERCIDEILQHADAATIQAVGVDTLVGNLVGVNNVGRPVTPVYTYADTRCAEDVHALRLVTDPAEVHQRTGCIIHTAYHPARMHWLRRTQPALFHAVDQWLDIGSYLCRQWFGQAVTSYSVASWSGMLNRADLSWDEDWLRLLGLRAEQLSQLADYNTIHAGLSSDYAKRWPRLKDTPFCLPVGDGVAANIGSGCVTPDQAAITVGTTAAVRTITDAPLPVVPSGLWSYRVDKTRHLIGGATTEGGNVYRWARETLQLGDRADLEDSLLAAQPDGHGLTILPLLAGERSPGWMPDATGTIHGLRLSTTPFEIVQGVLESVAIRLSLIAQQMAGVLAPNARMVASGGAIASSRAWAQMMADALGRPLYLTEEKELTARGTAIMALSALGEGHLSDYPPTINRIIEPRPAGVTALAAAKVRQESLYQAVLKTDTPRL